MFGWRYFTEILQGCKFCLLPASDKNCCRRYTIRILSCQCPGAAAEDSAALVDIMKRVSQLAINNPDLDD